jgi:hypothetical protein
MPAQAKKPSSFELKAFVLRHADVPELVRRMLNGHHYGFSYVSREFPLPRSNPVYRMLGVKLKQAVAHGELETTRALWNELHYFFVKDFPRLSAEERSGWTNSEADMKKMLTKVLNGYAKLGGTTIDV